LVNAREDNQ